MSLGRALFHFLIRAHLPSFLSIPLGERIDAIIYFAQFIESMFILILLTTPRYFSMKVIS